MFFLFLPQLQIYVDEQTKSVNEGMSFAEKFIYQKPSRTYRGAKTDRFLLWQLRTFHWAQNLHLWAPKSILWSVMTHGEKLIC